MKKFKQVFSFLLVLVCFNSFVLHAADKDKKVNYIVPDSRDVTMYQVNMRVFSKEGNFKGVTERLDSIKSLGVNVIYLMPVYPVGVLKSVNSPYCVRDYKGLNSEFGTIKDLQNLVERAHQKKMAIILDWVPNHTSYDHVWIQNKSWYLQDSAGNIISPPGRGWDDVAQLNFKNAEMRLAMIDAMKYWLKTASVDGFRCDFADGPPLDFWKQTLDSLRNFSQRKLLMMAEGKDPGLYKAGFDLNFGFEFFGGLKRIYARNKSVKFIDTLNITDYESANDLQRIIRYTSNHDVNSSDGTPIDLFGGRQGSMAAFAVAAFMKSVPMIYNGQEVGLSYRLTFPFTGTKIDWTPNTSITNEYKKIIAFRNSSAAIRRGVLISYSTDDVCAFVKQNGNEKVLVIVNMRNKPVIFNVPGAIAGTNWKNEMNAGNITVQKDLELQPYSYLVFSAGK